MSETKNEKQSFKAHVSRGFYRFVKMTIMAIKRFREPYYNGFAAQISYFICMSIVPMLMIIAQVLTVTDVISLETIQNTLEKVLGTELPDIVKSLLDTKVQLTSNIVFLCLSCWAASRAQFAISRIANYTLTNGETTGKGYFVERFRAIFTMLISIILACAALVILVYGEQLYHLVLSFINRTLNVQADVSKGWVILRWPLATMLFFIVISINYCVMPTSKARFRDVYPGSLLATFGLMIVTFIFSWYIKSVANYDIIYGSLASVAALLMWFYVLAWVICIGVMFNKLIDETRPAEALSDGEKKQK